MFIKICGLTHREAVEAAVEAGANALGFVFAPSVRLVTPGQARRLCEGLGEDILRVAVMHHPLPAVAAAVLDEFAPDWLQTDAEDFVGLTLPPACTALPVYHSGRLPPDAACAPRLLFDGPRSGSGEQGDWDEAGRLAVATRVILAGGLRADNVAEAIDSAQPWGVDVSSGVERAPGDKDPAKIHEFVRQVRRLAA